ncbi:hypothetical protein MMC22_008112 [Lobaria immixta]|nr:hypothetical protein [Lobaria immixta]
MTPTGNSNSNRMPPPGFPQSVSSSRSSGRILEIPATYVVEGQQYYGGKPAHHQSSQPTTQQGASPQTAYDPRGIQYSDGRPGHHQNPRWKAQFQPITRQGSSALRAYRQGIDLQPPHQASIQNPGTIPQPRQNAGRGNLTARIPAQNPARSSSRVIETIEESVEQAEFDAMFAKELAQIKARSSASRGPEPTSLPPVKVGTNRKRARDTSSGGDGGVQSRKKRSKTVNILSPVAEVPTPAQLPPVQLQRALSPSCKRTRDPSSSSKNDDEPRNPKRRMAGSVLAPKEQEKNKGPWGSDSCGAGSWDSNPTYVGSVSPEPSIAPQAPAARRVSAASPARMVPQAVMVQQASVVAQTPVAPQAPVVPVTPVAPPSPLPFPYNLTEDELEFPKFDEEMTEGELTQSDFEELGHQETTSPRDATPSPQEPEDGATGLNTVSSNGISGSGPSAQPVFTRCKFQLPRSKNDPSEPWFLEFVRPDAYMH